MAANNEALQSRCSQCAGTDHRDIDDECPVAVQQRANNVFDRVIEDKKAAERKVDELTERVAEYEYLMTRMQDKVGRFLREKEEALRRHRALKQRTEVRGTLALEAIGDLNREKRGLTTQVDDLKVQVDELNQQLALEKAEKEELKRKIEELEN
jgi:chromosome segregation ATPase